MTGPTPRDSRSAQQRSSKSMIRSLKFVGIPTRDQDRALAFWTEKIGLRVQTDQNMGPQRWIELRIPGADTWVVLFTPPGQENRIGTFFNGAFACDDVEATYRELLKKGVSFKGVPKQEPWGTFATFVDPDGNEFVLSGK
jgi:predicted enzyme related to lactoylglutathione lyase